MYVSTPPGTAALVSRLVITKSTTGTRTVVSAPALSPGVGSGPLAPSSVTAAAFVIENTPAGNGSATRTVTVRVTVSPPPPRLKPGQVTTPQAVARVLLADGGWTYNAVVYEGLADADWQYAMRAMIQAKWNLFANILPLAGA